MLRTEEALDQSVLRSVLLGSVGLSLFLLLFQTHVWSEPCKENILAFDILFDILFICTELNPPQLFIFGLRVAGTPAG